MKQLLLKYGLLFLFAFQYSGVFSQVRNTNTKLADHTLLEGNYYEAIEIYKEELVKRNDNVYLLIQLGTTYQKIGEFKEAHACFEKAFSLNNPEFPLCEMYLAQSYKTLGNYEKAKELFEHFKKNYKGNNSSFYTSKAKDEIKNCDLAIKAKTLPDYTLKPLDHINKRYSELSPFFYQDSLLLFSALPSDSLIKIPFEQSTPKNKIYFANWKDSVSKMNLFLPHFFTETAGDVSDLVISGDGQRMYFTECKMNSSGRLICEIYGSSSIKGEWQLPVKLGPLVNEESGEFNATHPSLSYDAKNKQDILYFASDRPGGNGGYDIWYAEVGSSFNIDKAYNLGRKFNSAENEITPFIEANSGNLFYSSNGFENYGGYDILMAADKGKSFEKPKNIGKPFNTSYDEFYYRTNTKNSGVFVSNRVDLQKKNCCDDIFYFSKEEYKYYSIKAIEKVNDTLNKELSDATFFIVNKKDSTYKAGNTYKGNINDSLVVEVSKKGYLKKSTTVQLKSLMNDTSLITVQLEEIKVNKEYRLNNLYFEYNKAELTPESLTELQSLLKFLQDNPELIIEVAAHTDNKGNAAYNLKLSQERAKSVVDYLVTNGVPGERLVAKGYGMNQPIAFNTNPDGSDNPEGRQQNRRIIFKVVGQLNTVNNEK